MFCDSFWDTYKDNFSYHGKRALFDYLENLSEDTGEDIELDIVALCCEYTEFESLKELQKSYPDIKSIADLENHTVVIPIDTGAGNERFIIQQY